MKILLSGATGFVGGRLAERFATEGHALRGFVRDPARWDAPAGAEVAVGDVTDGEAFAAAAEGVDVIVHGAALVSLWVKDRSQFDRVNVGGLQNAAAAARAAKAKLVHVSSFMALGPTDGATFVESSPRATTETHNDYERTKWLAEQEARKLLDQGVPIVRVYPGVVFGPGALTAGNHVVQLLMQHAEGKLPGMLGEGNLRQCFAYVDDVVDGIYRATTDGKSGSAYILGGENKTARELFASFERATGIAPPTRVIPFGVAKVIGKLQRWRAELFGTMPELTDEVVGVYRHEWAYSSARAERELGYTITPFDQAIAETVAWLRAQGHLKER